MPLQLVLGILDDLLQCLIIITDFNPLDARFQSIVDVVVVPLELLKIIVVFIWVELGLVLVFLSQRLQLPIQFGQLGLHSSFFLDTTEVRLNHIKLFDQSQHQLLL